MQTEFPPATGLRQMLEEYVNGMASLGHPAIVERFVLRNGKGYARSEAKPKYGKRGFCYENASKLWDATGLPYIEGFARRTEVPVPIQHAWNDLSGAAYDTTWKALNLKRKPSTFEYIGVPIPDELLADTLLRTGSYGVLYESGVRVNTSLIFTMDPELRKIVKQITGKEIA